MDATMAGTALRTLLAALTVLAALAAVPPSASGQPSPGTPVTLQDGAGDVTFTFQGQPAPVAGTTLYPGADLVSLSMREDRGSIAVTLGVAKLPSSQDPGMDGTVYDVFFTHNGREFRLEIRFVLPITVPQPSAQLAFRDAPSGEFDGLWATRDLLIDAAANTVTVDVPRELLADADGAAPYPGRALEGISVLSRSAFGGSGVQIIVPLADGYEVSDAMPDDPAMAATLPIALGVQQTGTARLASVTPFRASNGEATTFIYNVSVVNLAAENDSFELSATGVPAGFTLVLPVPFVFVEAGSAAEVPVLLTMPFGHQHGDLASFVLEAQSLSDPGSVGRIEMGVRFLAVPQPAGHHDTVYLHSGPGNQGFGPLFQSEQGYMNTLEVDPNDLGVNLYNTGWSQSGAGEWSAWWTFPLSPSLEMGLDIDGGKVGHIKVPIGTTVPALQARMQASLEVFTPDGGFGGFFFGDGEALATMEETAPIDITGGPVLFEGDLLPMGDQRIPFEAGNDLMLTVQLTWVGPNGIGAADETPYVAPGGSAVLPLREWHDAVDAVLSTVGGPAMAALGPQERLVNPGEAVVFPVSITNPLDEGLSLVFEVTGSNREWVTLPSASLRAGPKETLTTSVVVRAPPSAVDQERADLVLMAYSEDRPEARGLLRLVAQVDTDEDQADDTAVAEGLAKKGTPAPGALPVLGLLALVALALRRR